MAHQFDVIAEPIASWLSQLKQAAESFLGHSKYVSLSSQDLLISMKEGGQYSIVNTIMRVLWIKTGQRK